MADGAAVPDGFECTITQDVMEDPVVAADGHSYERAAIEQWLTERRTSPLTGAALASRALLPNIALRKAIAAWRVGEAAPQVGLGRFVALYYRSSTLYHVH